MAESPNYVEVSPRTTFAELERVVRQVHCVAFVIADDQLKMILPKDTDTMECLKLLGLEPVMPGQLPPGCTRVNPATAPDFTEAEK
jgi:hypothetical protein